MSSAAGIAPEGLTGSPIQMARPSIGPREEELALEVLRSGHLSLGPMGPRFEEAFAGFVGTAGASTVSSGTAGLHVAVRIAGAGPGDEVITSPYSFVASANCALYEGATPVFAEIDPTSLNLDPDAVEAAITPRTKAIVAVHIFGLPCAIERISEIGRRHGIPVIEDAAQAVGARRQGRMIGTHGNPAVFAFYPNKQMTTGEGGMVTSDDPAYTAQVESLRNQGRADSGQWLAHDRLGWNYRLSDVSSAIGLGQTERLPAILAARAATADGYAEVLTGLDGVTLPAVVDGDTRSWFVYTVILAGGIDRNRVIGDLAELGIASKPYLPAIHLQPFYRDLGHVDGELPICEDVARRSLALPFYAEMERADQERVAAALAWSIGQRS